MGTNVNGYEIRLQLIQMAKDQLHEAWYAKKDEAMHNAQLRHEAVQLPAPPTFEEIETLAKKLYAFVQERGV